MLQKSDEIPSSKQVLGNIEVSDGILFILYYFLIWHYLLSEATIISSWIKSHVGLYSPSFVSLAICLAYLVISFLSNKKVRIVFGIKDQLWGGLVLALASFLAAITFDLFLELFFGTVESTFNYWLKYILIFLIFMIELFGGRSAEMLFKPFKHFFLFVLFTSIVLLVFLMLPIDDQYIDVSFLRKNAEGNNGESLYTFPFGLGLLITGQNRPEFLGLEFYQYCSYFIEPQVFVFFFIPACFMFLKYKGIGKILVWTAAFLVLWAHSFTSLVGLAVVVLIHAVRNYPKTTLVLLMVFGMLFLSFYSDSMRSSAQSAVTVLRKLESSSAEATKSRLMFVLDKGEVLGQPLSSKSYDRDIDQPISVVSSFFWISFVVLVFAVSLLGVFRKWEVAVCYAAIYLTVSVFKSLEHAPQSFVFLFVAMSLFAKAYQHASSRIVGCQQ